MSIQSEFIYFHDRIKLDYELLIQTLLKLRYINPQPPLWAAAAKTPLLPWIRKPVSALMVFTSWFSFADWHTSRQKPQVKPEEHLCRFVPVEYSTGRFKHIS